MKQQNLPTARPLFAKVGAGIGVAALLTLTPLGLLAQSTTPVQTNQSDSVMSQMNEQDSQVVDPQAQTAAQTATVSDPTRISAATISPFQQSYFTVIPSTNDSEVTLVMDITNGSNEDSGETTFFVFSPSGLETLRTGVRPEYSNVAAGTMMSRGSYDGKLTATFRIVGNTPYTVLVVNRNNNIATYDLRVVEGTLRQ